MRGGAFFNGKEGRVDFRTTVRKDGLVFGKNDDLVDFRKMTV